MDLVYVSEVLTYGGFFRNHQYRDYEQPWNSDYFNGGRSTRNHCRRQHQEQRQLSKDNCHLCRESKRRSLAAYIRGKSRRNSCQEIHEEEEEQDIVNTRTENDHEQVPEDENENCSTFDESKKPKKNDTSKNVSDDRTLHNMNRV